MPSGRYARFAHACVAMAPTCGSAAGTTAPTARNFDWTATPHSPASRSHATIEYVEITPGFCQRRAALRFVLTVCLLTSAALALWLADRNRLDSRISLINLTNHGVNPDLILKEESDA